MPMIDEQQAYRAMLRFVRYYYDLTDSEDVMLMLEAMELVGDRETSDPGTWSDWARCVGEVLDEDKRADAQVFDESVDDSRLHGELGLLGDD